MPHPCVKRSFLSPTFLSHTKRGWWMNLLRLSFFLPIWPKTDYPQLFLPVCRSVLASHGFFPYIRAMFKRVENMEICYIEAGVLEGRMLARAENLSARVDRLYEETAVRNPESDWTARMSACALTSRRVPHCRLSAIPDGWRSPASSASSITKPGDGEADGPTSASDARRKRR